MTWLDTKEKFEKHRYEMAKRAQTRHAKGVAEGKTCVDCHFGIAHKEPDGPGPQDLPTAASTR